MNSTEGRADSPATWHLKVDRRRLFPPGDRTATTRLQFIAAANDARRLEGFIRSVRGQLGDELRLNDVEKRFREGELQYLFRILCGHLYECGLAYQALLRADPATIRELAAVFPGVERAREFISSVYLDQSRAGFFMRVLKAIRDSGAFHYGLFAKGSFDADLPPQAELIIDESSTLSRYAITDMFSAALLGKILGKERAAFQRAAEQALQLGVEVARFADPSVDT